MEEPRGTSNLVSQVCHSQGQDLYPGCLKYETTTTSACSFMYKVSLMILSAVLSGTEYFIDDIGHFVANILCIVIFWHVFDLSQLCKEVCFFSLSLSEVAHHINKTYLTDYLSYCDLILFFSKFS
jgi:hypothetical protein